MWKRLFEGLDAMLGGLALSELSYNVYYVKLDSIIRTQRLCCTARSMERDTQLPFLALK